MHLDKLRDQVVADFTKAWAVNDSAHQIGHFSNVEECGNVINDALGLGYDPKLIMLVAHFHDMYAWDRGNHHLMSAHWVGTTDYKMIVELDPHDRYLVQLGCKHHRASFKGNFISKFDELMNAADREIPGNVDAMLERAIQYRIGKGSTREKAILPAIEHIREKFGDSGYARYPQMYLDVFADQLAEQRRAINNL